MYYFQAEDGIRDLVRSRGLGDVYKRQAELRAEMAERSRSTFIAVFTANAAVAGLVLAALQLSLIHI